MNWKYTLTDPIPETYAEGDAIMMRQDTDGDIFMASLIGGHWLYLPKCTECGQQKDGLTLVPFENRTQWSVYRLHQNP